ncbi:MAG: histidine phosphatase family protein [Pseudomonadota bacterium]
MAEEYRQHKFSYPKGAVDLTLIRHGESEPARPGESFPMVDGHGDPALHADGLVQAEAVGQRLGHERFDALYVTTLRRTHQTMAPLAKRLDMTPAVEPDLREVCLGDWDGGLYRIKAAQRDPLFVRSLEEHEWGHIPGAETTAQVFARVEAALARVLAAHADERIAICVHGGIIAAVMALATGARPFTFLGAENGSIHRFVLGPEGLRVRTFNEVSHL